MVMTESSNCYVTFAESTELNWTEHKEQQVTLQKDAECIIGKAKLTKSDCSCTQSMLAINNWLRPSTQINTANTSDLISLVLLCLRLVFTARCYASAVLAMGRCPCLSVSVTSRCFTKTAKGRITQTTPHDTTGTLVFCCQRSPRNSTGVTPYGGAKCKLGGSNSANFDK